MTGSQGALPVPTLVLASASPRRAEILRMLGFEPEVVHTHVDESRRAGEGPRPFVERLAREKAEAGWETRRGSLVLGGDTVVVLDGHILEKPRDRAHAVEMLGVLAGRTHRVLTGMALVGPKGDTWSLVAEASVAFRAATSREIEAYVETGEPMDKAGGYGIQGYGATLVDSVDGDYYAVVGLSVSVVLRLMASAGLAYAYPGLRWMDGADPDGR